jgi:hypothetical protein
VHDLILHLNVSILTQTIRRRARYMRLRPARMSSDIQRRGGPAVGCHRSVLAPISIV